MISAECCALTVYESRVTQAGAMSAWFLFWCQTGVRPQSSARTLLEASVVPLGAPRGPAVAPRRPAVAPCPRSNAHQKKCDLILTLKKPVTHPRVSRVSVSSPYGVFYEVLSGRRPLPSARRPPRCWGQKSPTLVLLSCRAAAAWATSAPPNHDRRRANPRLTSPTCDITHV